MWDENNRHRTIKSLLDEYPRLQIVRDEIISFSLCRWTQIDVLIQIDVSSNYLLLHSAQTNWPTSWQVEKSRDAREKPIITSFNGFELRWKDLISRGFRSVFHLHGGISALFDGGAVNYTHLCSHFNVDSGKLKTFFILTVLLVPSAKEKSKCVQERTQLCSLAEIWENMTHMKYEQQIWNNNNDVLFLCLARSSHFKQGQCCWFASGLLCKLNNVVHGAGQMPAYEKCNKNHKPVNEDLK